MLSAPHGRGNVFGCVFDDLLGCRVGTFGL
jgi:hypothetical protein